MTTCVQAGNAGCFFQNTAALFGLCLNDLPNAALMDECGRTRAGRGIREKDLHIARAHIASVDAIVRAGIAFDPASNFQRVLIVKGGRSRAR